MRKRTVFHLCIQISVLTVLAFLYGLSLLLSPPKYWESIVCTAILLILFGAGCVKLIPTLSAMLLGEEPHLIREGERTFRRCGARELFKLFVIVLFVRLLEFPLTYIIHFALFGYSGTFFEVQRLWLDFYHPEIAFPLYGYLSNIFWLLTVNFNHARFIGSYVFTTMAVVVLYYLVQLDFDRKTARRAVRYFLVMPFALSLMGTVPDGLFLLFSILTLLFLRRNRFIIANVFAMLTVLTHALGILLFAPILISYISYLIGNIRNNRVTEKRYILKQVFNTLSILLIPVGIGLVMLYSRLRFGNAMSLYSYMLGVSGVGVTGLFSFFDNAFQQLKFVGGSSFAVFTATYLPQIGYFVFGLIMLILACNSIPTAFSILMAVTLPLIVATGHVSASARIITMTAPFVITLAVRIKKRWVDAVTTSLLFIGWLAYFFAFIAGYTGEMI